MFSKLKAKFNKILAKDGRGHDFTSEEQLQSQVSRSKKSVRTLELEIQKAKLDEKKQQLQRLKDELEMRRMDKTIAEYEDYLDDEDDEDDEDESIDLSMLGMNSADAQLIEGLTNLAIKTGLIKPAVLNTSTPTEDVQTSKQPSDFSHQSDVSDEEIQNVINQIPKPTMKLLKKQSDEQLKVIIKNNYAGVTEPTIKRTIEMIRQ